MPRYSTMLSGPATHMLAMLMSGRAVRGKRLAAASPSTPPSSMPNALPRLKNRLILAVAMSPKPDSWKYRIWYLRGAALGARHRRSCCM